MPDLPTFNCLLDEAQELLPAAIALRRRIHSKPELGLDLPLTTEAVLDGLPGLDIGIARGPSTSGLVVSLSGTQPGSRYGRTPGHRLTPATRAVRSHHGKTEIQGVPTVGRSTEGPGCVKTLGAVVFTQQ